MKVYILQGVELPDGVEEGFIICFGLKQKEIYVLCETRNYADMVKFQKEFTRKSGFKARKPVLSLRLEGGVLRILSLADLC